MTQPATAPVLRLGAPEDLLHAIPYLLGFHPERSLVLTALAGPRQRVVFQARLDLEPRGAFDECWPQVARALDDLPDVNCALLVAYAGEGKAGLTLARHSVRAARRRLAQRGVPVKDALWVHEERFGSWECRDQRCCPTGGRPVPSRQEVQAGVVAATATAAGLVALPSRNDLALELEPIAPSESLLACIAAAKAQAVRGSAARDQLERAGFEAVIDRLLALELRPEGELLAAPALSAEELAALLVTLANRTCRDRLIFASAQLRGDRRVLGMWLDVVRRTPRHLVTAPAVVLAVLQWDSGAGAQARTALEVGLAQDPAYSLGLLLQTFMDNGLRMPIREAALWDRVRSDLQDPQ